MDKDLYIEFLESEIRRIRAGANTHYGQSIGWMDEMEDLKLENDRLRQRNEIMHHFITSVRCKGLVCESCDLHFLNDQGTDLCAQVDHVKLESIATDILNKVDKL